MTVSEAIIKEFAIRGTRHFFGLPGSGVLLDLIESGRTNNVAFIPTANESSAAISAAYYSRLSGAPGLAIAIPGPGAANLAAGAAFAYFERMPVVCLCERRQLGDDAPMVQRCDQPSLFSAVVKNKYVLGPDTNHRETLINACDVAESFRPGPVLLEVPKDATTWTVEQDTESYDSAIHTADSAGIDDAVALLSAFRRPVLIAGGDALRSKAAVELKHFAHAFCAPVLVSIDGRGVFQEEDPLFAGTFPNLAPENILANRLLNDCDGIIAIGIDPLACEAPWTKSIRVCEICVDDAEPSFFGDGHLRLCGEIGVLLNALRAETVAEKWQESTPPAADRNTLSIGRAQAARASVAGSFSRPIGARFAVQDIIEVSRSLIPSDGVLFTETGVFVLMFEYLWRVGAPDTFFGTAGGRSMGLMLPALLGGKLAKPDTPMLGIGGDGSTLMRLGELAAFANAGVAAPIVVVNDSALGTIKSRQKGRGLANYGLDLSPTDFAAAGRAAGLNGIMVETPEEFEIALKGAFDSQVATVIDARVDGDAYRDSFGPTAGI